MGKVSKARAQCVLDVDRKKMHGLRWMEGKRLCLISLVPCRVCLLSLTLSARLPTQTRPLPGFS